jgi:Fic family protein
MAGKFELRTRHQFAGIVEKRNRWMGLRAQPAARDRWERLVGPYWARQNCALEEVSDAAAWQPEVLDGRRTLQLQSHMASAQTLIRFTEERKFLFPKDLLEIHRLLLSDSEANSNAGNYRQRETKSLGEGHEPTDVELVPAIVANALEWFGADSFAEMHEVEKTALMLIKLIDIQPFDESNGKTLRLFCNFFLLKAGYPPAIISPARASQNAIAIQNALRFHTQPMIDLIAEAVEQGLGYLLDEPTPPKLTVLSA